MPSLLSEGCKRYNESRRIHPQDPVSNLSYYIPTPSCSSYSTSNEKIGYCSSSQETNCRSSSEEGLSNYSPKFGRALTRRRLPVNRSSNSPNQSSTDFSSKLTERRSKLGCSSVISSNSPLSSGFDDGTLIEQTIVEYNSRPSYQVNLKDSNYNSRALKDPLPKEQYLDSYQMKTSRQESGVRKLTSQSKPNVSRLKRRFNRRMLISGDGLLDNPYALSELFSQSEIPGFREIFASDSYLRKLCWIVAFLIMTALSLRDIMELLTQYYEYPITVDVRLKDSARLPFPAVTVCNLNVVRWTALCGPSSARFNLTYQIPSDMRDKLCGLQLDKKNTSDSDISDINNIGITTATSSTITTSIPDVNGTTANPGDNGNSSEPHKPLNHTDPTQTTSVYTTPTPMEPEHKSSPVTTPSGSQKKMSTVSGGLDLGDFADHSMLVKDQGLHRILQPSKLRQGRSIRLAEDDNQERPFASSRSRVRIRTANEQELNFRRPDQQQNQMSRLAVSMMANRISNVPSNQQPNHPVRNVNPSIPGSVTVNSFQNLNAFGLFTTPSSTPTSSQTSTTTFSPPALPDDFELSERQERELQDNLTNLLAVMYNRDPQFTKSLGHQFDDMILRCTMKSRNCTNHRGFMESFTPTEGNCFTYRSKIRRRSTDGLSNLETDYEQANLASINHGLELVLNLEKNEYISSSSQVGALVMIHHPGDLGYTASEATFVAPEYTTYIGVKMVNLTRLPHPYPENCVDSWPSKFADTLTMNTTYSQQACLRICLQKTTQSHCHCQSAVLPIVESDNQRTTISNSMDKHVNQSEHRIFICDTKKLATRQCVNEVMLRAADRLHNCECPPKCHVIKYDKTISMARWPSKEDRVTFDGSKVDVNFQNLAKVIVYFQSMTSEHITQQAALSNGAPLLSAIGGIMGMYVGFSFLSVFEIFEVMSRKMWHHFKTKLSNTSTRLDNTSRA